MKHISRTYSQEKTIEGHKDKLQNHVRGEESSNEDANNIFEFESGEISYCIYVENQSSYPREQLCYYGHYVPADPIFPSSTSVRCFRFGFGGQRPSQGCGSLVGRKQKIKIKMFGILFACHVLYYK